jgi:hypothetical protein
VDREVGFEVIDPEMSLGVHVRFRKRFRRDRR